MRSAGRAPVLCATALLLIGCQHMASSPAEDHFVPFEGADVVQPNQTAPETSVDQFIVDQLRRYASQASQTLCIGQPEVLWFDGGPSEREGVAVVLLARADLYRQVAPRRLEGPTQKLLTDLIGSVGGQVINVHRIPAGSVARIDLPVGTVAQAAYAVLHSAGLTGRILNADRWVIGSFQQGSSPVEAFRPIFDRFWEACESLRESQPVLSIVEHAGEQILGEDDLRLKRLYRRAGRQVAWPNYAGCAPDPGLQFGPPTSQPRR
jgi:hypothetical protein